MFWFDIVWQCSVPLYGTARCMIAREFPPFLHHVMLYVIFYPKPSCLILLCLLNCRPTLGSVIKGFCYWCSCFCSVESVIIFYNMVTALVLVRWFLSLSMEFSWNQKRYFSFQIPVSEGSRKLTKMIKYLLIYYYFS